MKIRKIIPLFLGLSLLNLFFGILTPIFANNNQDNIKQDNTNQEIILEKKDSNGKVKTIKLTQEEIKKLEKEKGYLKIIESIYKKNKKIFIGFTMDKNIQEQLYADPITFNFISRDFYVNSLKNQLAFGTFLEKSEALRFLSDLKNQEPIQFNIETDKHIIKGTLIPKKNISSDSIRYEYYFKVNLNGDKCKIEEIKANNTSPDLFDTKCNVTNYIEKEVKIIPGFLGYSNTWQIVIFAIVIVICIGTIVFGYLYNNLNKNNLK